MKAENRLKRWILFFILSLVVSGATAIPVLSELELATRLIPEGTFMGDWLYKIYLSLKQQEQQAPFLAYGYDWLAFAHFVLAILFIGPLKDPVKNSWVIEFGMIACLLVIPYALVAGHFRSIPVWWRLIDCSFGVAGFFILRHILRLIQVLEEKSEAAAVSVSQEFF